MGGFAVKLSCKGLVRRDLADPDPSRELVQNKGGEKKRYR